MILPRATADMRQGEIMRFYRFLSRHGVEIFLALSLLLNLVQNARKLTPKEAWGLALFLGGLIFAIRKIRDGVERSQGILGDLTKLVERVDQSVVVLQGDSNFRELAETGKAIDSRRQPHLLASHDATRRVFEHAGGLLKGLKELQRQESNLFRIDERYIINDLLHELALCLPKGSIWFGATHLTKGWQDQDADPGFVNFRETIQRRVKQGELRVLRLYCLGGEEAALSEHFKDELAAGITVGVLPEGENPPDLSLIYLGSEDDVTFNADIGRPSIDHESVALCALEFRTRARRSIDSVHIHAPGSEDFKYLGLQFDKAWSRRQRLSV